MMRLCLPLVLLGFFVSEVAAQSAIFVVRHAEKADGTEKDPGLSAAGQLRAESLASILKDAGITAIYATEFKRTQETAAPLAKALTLGITKFPAKDSTALVAKLRDLHEGNALVVGHSNTVPQLIKSLGIDAPIKISDTDYDNLFVVTPGAKARFVRLHYH